MTKDEALKLALEALESCNWVDDGGYGHAEYDHVSTNKAITAIREALAHPEFVTHAVENVEDWSEWVCPDPQSYLMKCCGCGLVHEMQFKVVRYKSKDEREECDVVDDPNLQAVFRMRRSEEWSPKDTAYRPGGLAQPEQEPHSWYSKQEDEWMTHKTRMEHEQLNSYTHKVGKFDLALYTTPPQRKPLTDEEIDVVYSGATGQSLRPQDKPLAYKFARAVETKLQERT